MISIGDQILGRDWGKVWILCGFRLGIGLKFERKSEIGLLIFFLRECDLSWGSNFWSCDWGKFGFCVVLDFRFGLKVEKKREIEVLGYLEE